MDELKFEFANYNNLIGLTQEDASEGLMLLIELDKGFSPVLLITPYATVILYPNSGFHSF